MKGNIYPALTTRWDCAKFAVMTIAYFTLLKSQEVEELLGLLRLCEGRTLAEGRLAGEGGSRFDPAQTTPRPFVDVLTIWCRHKAVSLQLISALNGLLFENLKAQRKKAGRQVEPALSEYTSESRGPWTPFPRAPRMEEWACGGCGCPSFPSTRATLLLPGLCLGFRA